MKKSTEVKASTIDLAVEQALLELNTTREHAEIEVLQKGGLFSKATVRVTVIEDDAASKAEELVNGILDKMHLTSRAIVKDDGGTLYIEISGEDSGVAIGYRGEALDAFQYLVLTYLNQEKCEFKKVVVDSENYREKRKETLTALALRLAEKAHRTCRKVELEPMNPFERRVIHSALADSELAETTSEGEEPNRHVVIIPKGVEIIEDKPYGARRDGRGDRRQGDRRQGDRRQGDRGNDRGRRDDRSHGDRKYGDRPERPERAPRPEEPEVPDGTVYRYFTEPQPEDDFVKPAAAAKPPKFKSFGGQKKR